MKVLFLNPRKNVLGGFVAQLKSEGSRGDIDVDVMSGGIIKESVFGKGKSFLALAANLFTYLVKFVLGKRRFYDVIVLNGILTAFPYLLLSKVFARLNPKEKYVVIFFYIHGFGMTHAVKRIIRFVLNSPRVTILVQNPEEILYYRELAERLDVRYFPYCQDAIETSGREGEGEEYIFAGGYTNRDYECLIKAAAEIDARFVIIGSRLNRIDAFPPNVRVFKDVGTDIFYGYLKNSRIVVLPLKEQSGSSGQMVALAAMSFGKPVVYADVASVAQYFERGISGISYEPGNAGDLADKLSCLLSETRWSAELGNRALERYRSRFQLSMYYAYLIGLIMDLNPSVE